MTLYWIALESIGSDAIDFKNSLYTSHGHNLRIYPPSGGHTAALQIACVERTHGAICALHRIPRDAAKSAIYGRAKYDASGDGVEWLSSLQVRQAPRIIRSTPSNQTQLINKNSQNKTKITQLQTIEHPICIDFENKKGVLLFAWRLASFQPDQT